MILPVPGMRRALVDWNEFQGNTRLVVTFNAEDSLEFEAHAIPDGRDRVLLYVHDRGDGNASVISLPRTRVLDARGEVCKKLVFRAT